MGGKARAAALALAVLSDTKKNEILRAMAAGIRSAASEILEANAEDIAAGEKRGLTLAMLDRLRLDADRLEAVACGVEKVATLPDPVGEILDEWDRPNGIRIQQLRVPIGVIGIIYESRPNVTSDAAVLCLKSGNATILRGGSEAIHSNRALADALQSGGENEGLPEGSIQLVPFTDRDSVSVMAGMDRYLDLIIPRGGKGLIETVVSFARMPVIKHYDGICHAYIHSDADLEMAVRIVVDSKTQKPSVCNALETLLVDEAIASEFLPRVAAALMEKNVELRGDEATCAIIDVKVATEEDWRTEYLDSIISIKTVKNVKEGVNHILKYGTMHTDSIITNNKKNAQIFLNGVNSSIAMHNVSTQFADGGEFGFGGEIGISTNKLPPRGPVGINQLTSYKYLVSGNGIIRQ